MFIDENNRIIDLPDSSIRNLPLSIANKLKKYEPNVERPDVLKNIKDESESHNIEIKERNDNGKVHSGESTKRRASVNKRGRKARSLG